MSKDPWETAGPPGSWGRPGMKQSSGVRFAKSTWFVHRGELRSQNEDGDGLYERAAAALSSGDDSRFRRLVARFSRMFEW
jgi:hypothetical protein